MCGIAGIIAFNPMSSATNLVNKMNERLAHRGPDGEGIWVSENQKVHFGHRRLAIIDLSDDAAQPMTSFDERFVITYNGELYNYQELRILCEKAGSHFLSHSDTEVIIECFRHWRVDAFKKFKGMWAFAIYDKKTNTLTFSRDPFGIKPLYYGAFQGNLYFASEPKALRQINTSFNDIDEVSVKLFVEQGFLDRGDWTFFKNIKRFPHAHYSEISLNQFSFDHFIFKRYWSPPKQIIAINRTDAARELKRLLKESVKIHLRSDVPIGSCLSGGIDSSAIVCIAHQLLLPSQKINTFTVHYPHDPDINEEHWAKKIIDHTKAHARFCEPTYEDFVADFDRLLDTQDEPFGSTSIFAQYSIFKTIGKSPVKVVLDGQGSDEMLAGYLGFIPQFLQSLLTTGRLFSYIKQGFQLSKSYGSSYSVKAAFKALTLQKKSLMNDKKRLYGDEWNHLSNDTYETRLENILSFNSENFNDTLTALLCETNIPQLLRYEDRDSMAFSIESRVPFLEPDLVNFILSLPADLKISGGMTKAVLREAIKDIVPDAVRLRKDKLGFPTPEKKWIKKYCGIDTTTGGGNAWRELVTERWRQLLSHPENNLSISSLSQGTLESV